MKPEISVIVPTYNGASRISSCLESILNQNTSRIYEIIVVDDGSTDDTAHVVSTFPEIRLFVRQNRGPAAARNFGVSQALGNIIVFTDDDCIPLPDWLENLVQPLDDSRVTGCKGAYLSKQSEVTAQFVQIEYEEKYEILAGMKETNLIDTYSAAFRKSAFSEVGGFDESFPNASVEDRDLSIKLAQAGHKLVFVPTALVYHTHAAGQWVYFKKKFKNGFWGMTCLMKYPKMAVNTSDTPKEQRFQILLVAAFSLASVLALFHFPIGLALLGVFTLAFLVSTGPLVTKAWNSSIKLAMATPYFLFLRASALLLGLFSGLVRYVVDSKFLQKTPLP
jgi:glycosyltransferase involved in cell wall biosynthesis